MAMIRPPRDACLVAFTQVYLVPQHVVVALAPGKISKTILNSTITSQDARGIIHTLSVFLISPSEINTHRSHTSGVKCIVGGGGHEGGYDGEYMSSKVWNC